MKRGRHTRGMVPAPYSLDRPWRGEPLAADALDRVGAPMLRADPLPGLSSGAVRAVTVVNIGSPSLHESGARIKTASLI